jgi:hypothetical protein
MGDFTKIAVWKKAHELTLRIYGRTARWPHHELFGLTSQTRRAAASIAANIAEGGGRNSDAELARYARTSLGWANGCPTTSFWPTICATSTARSVMTTTTAFQKSGAC